MKRPKDIHVTNVEIGDFITVTQPTRKGLTTTVSGRVRFIKLEGQSRFYFTEDKSIIFALQPGMTIPKITVYDREPQAHTPLFEMSE